MVQTADSLLPMSGDMLASERWQSLDESASHYYNLGINPFDSLLPS
jgi:hypothetical protein